MWSQPFFETIQWGILQSYSSILGKESNQCASIYAKGNAIYIPPITRLDTTNSIVLQTSFKQELLGDGYVLKDHKNKFANANV
jgi:hypothetical protein